MQLACCVVFPSCCVPCVTVRSEIQNLLLPQCSISLLLSHTSSTNKVVLTAADYSNKDSIRICTFSLYVELNHSNEGEGGGGQRTEPPPTPSLCPQTVGFKRRDGAFENRHAQQTMVYSSLWNQIKNTQESFGLEITWDWESLILKDVVCEDMIGFVVFLP